MPLTIESDAISEANIVPLFADLYRSTVWWNTIPPSHFDLGSESALALALNIPTLLSTPAILKAWLSHLSL